MAQRGKINEFFDVAEFEKQRAQVVKGVEEYIALVERAPEIRVQIKATDSIKAAAEGMGKLADNNKKVVETTNLVITRGEQLERTQKAVNNTLNAAAKGADEASESYAVLLKASAQNLVVNDKLKEKLAELRKARRDGIITEEQYIEKIAQVKEQQVALQVSNQQINAGLKALEKSYQSAAGSLDQMNATLTVLKLGYRGLSDEEKKSKIGVAAQKEIEKLTDEIRDQEKKIGDFSKNVGRYAESLAGGFESVSREIARLKREQASLQDGPGGPEQEANLKRTADGIRELEQIQRVSLETGKSYSQTLRTIDQEFINLSHSGNVSEEFLKEFKQFLADSKREAADLKKEIKAIGSETRVLDGVASAFSAIVSGAEAAYGASVLLSGENEHTEKTIKKLIAVQSVANGVREFAKQLTEKETVVGKAYNVVVQQTNLLFSKGATAAQRFGVAIKAIGIGLAIFVLSKAIEFLGEFEDKAEDAAEALEKLNKEIEKNNKITEDFNRSQEFSTKQSLEQLKAANATKAQLYEEELAGRKEQLARALKNLENANDDVITEEIRQAQFLRALREQGIDEISKERAEALKKQLEAVRKNAEVSKEAVRQQQRDLILFNKQDQTRQADDARKRVEQELKAAVEINKIRRDALADQQREFADISIFGEAGRVRALENEFKLRKANLEEQRDLEFKLNSLKNADEQLTANQRLAIITKTNDEIRKLELKLSADKIRINIEELTKLRDLREQLAEDAANALLETQGQATAALERELQNEEKLRQRALDAIARQEADSIIKLDAQYNKELQRKTLTHEQKLKLDRDYEARRLEIENKGNLERLSAELTSQRRILNTADISKEEREEALRRIAELEKQIADASVKNTQDSNNKKKASDDAYYDHLAKRITTTGQLFGNVIGLITELGSIGIDRENARIEENIAALEKKKEKDVEVINASVLSEKEKADKLAVIEATADARKQALERRKRQLEIERARFEKAANIARIITETAAAVVTTLGDKTIIPGFLRIPLAVTIGALGAAQLARAVATPLPKYYKGKPSTDNYEGFGIVGDGGRREAIIRARGGVEVTADKPTITWVGRDDIIMPDADKWLSGLGGLTLRGLPAPGETYDYAPAIVAGNKLVAAKLDKLNHTLANKREVVFERPPVMDRVVKHKQGNREYFKMNGFDV